VHVGEQLATHFQSEQMPDLQSELAPQPLPSEQFGAQAGGAHLPLVHTPDAHWLSALHGLPSGQSVVHEVVHMPLWQSPDAHCEFVMHGSPPGQSEVQDAPQTSLTQMSDSHWLAVLHGAPGGQLLLHVPEMHFPFTHWPDAHWSPDEQLLPEQKSLPEQMVTFGLSHVSALHFALPLQGTALVQSCAPELPVAGAPFAPLPAGSPLPLGPHSLRSVHTPAPGPRDA
jgi:hypothetical protein